MNMRIFYIILFSLIESIQTVVFISWGASFFPSLKPFINEMTLYLVFCCSVLGWGIGLKRRWKDRAPSFQVRLFCVIEALLTFLWLSALFKTVIYDRQPQMAQGAFVVVLCLLIAHKLWWVKIQSWLGAFMSLAANPSNWSLARTLSGVLFPMFIFFLIYIPDTQAVVARIWIGEQFHHWDSSVMAPAWAYVSGAILDVDVISRYGLGLPMIVGFLTKIFGGFSHENVFLVLMWLTIVYYLLWYAFLVKWWDSRLMALAAIILGIRLQMFHSESLPICFTYPSSTVLRYCFDIPVLFLIFAHLNKPKQGYLLAAACICGLAIFHITPEGVYLTCAFYFYLVACLGIPSLRATLYRSSKDILSILRLFLFVPVTAVGLLWFSLGEHCLQKEFWQNSFEFVNSFKSGLALTPMYQSLIDHQFLASLVSFLYPLVYMMTVLVVTSLCFFKKIHHRHLFAAVLSVYGMGLYHYYVALSSTSAYYSAGLPFIFLCCYWGHLGLLHYDAKRYHRWSLGLLAVAVYALVTNHLFIAYPNIFNFSRNPMVDLKVSQIPPGRVSYFNHLFREYPDAFKLTLNSLGETTEDLWMEKDFQSDEDLKAYYRKEFDFIQDALLIDRLTLPQEAVALISSFEVKMLIQANRKPFFYYFDLVNSRPLRMRMFVVPNYFTVDATQRTLNQLIQAKPEYVFMERIFLNRQVPRAYYHDSQGIMEVIDYVNDNYSPTAFGQYLVAMKRKN